MLDDERSSMVVQLQEILQRAGYGPVVDQHRNAVADGRFVEFRTEDIERSGRRARPDQPKVGDVRRVELSPEEQLAHLLDLVEVAVGGTLAIEERALEVASKFAGGNGPVTVTFVPDTGAGEADEQQEQDLFDTVEESDGWALQPGALGRREAVAQVLETVHLLRVTADLTRASWLEPQLDGRTPGDRTIGDW